MRTEKIVIPTILIASRSARIVCLALIFVLLDLLAGCGGGGDQAASSFSRPIELEPGSAKTLLAHTSALLPNLTPETEVFESSGNDTTLRQRLVRHWSPGCQRNGNDGAVAREWRFESPSKIAGEWAMVGTLYEYFYADTQCTQYKWRDETRMSATYKGAVTAPAGARPGGAADVFDVVFHEGASIPAGRYAFGLYPSTRAVRIGQGNWFEGGYVDAITWDSK